jgi:hypothetical protein
MIEMILERLQSKGCPQGLNVMAEELQWMGRGSITHERLRLAVRAELRLPHPRIRRVVEGVYWFTDHNVPAGWSLFLDRRTLPCFYRLYPPAISWDDIDKAENILPQPGINQFRNRQQVPSRRSELANVSFDQYAARE